MRKPNQKKRRTQSLLVCYSCNKNQHCFNQEKKHILIFGKLHVSQFQIHSKKDFINNVILPGYHIRY